MNCTSSFTDGSGTNHACTKATGHDGLHNDGGRVSWDGSWAGDGRHDDEGGDW